MPRPTSCLASFWPDIRWTAAARRFRSERCTAGNRGDRIPDGPRSIRGQEVCRGQQAVWRVSGQISAGRPQPDDSDLSAVQQAIAETEYLMARDQFAAKKYAEANKLFGEFLARYPLDGRSPTIPI